MIAYRQFGSGEAADWLVLHGVPAPAASSSQLGVPSSASTSAPCCAASARRCRRAAHLLNSRHARERRIGVSSRELCLGFAQLFVHVKRAR